VVVITGALRRTVAGVARGTATAAVAAGLAAATTLTPAAAVSPLDAADAAPAISTPARPDTAPFTLVVVPDTQESVRAGTDTFTAQTTWIAANADRLDVAFVLHEGDVVNDLCDPAQWARGSAAMQVLDDADVPYAIAPGNHDLIAYAPVCEPQATVRRTDDVPFTTTFPAARFNRRTFGGSFSPDSTANTFHTFTAGGTDYLVIALQFGPRAEHLTWATRIAAEHPDHHVVVLTHDLIGPDGLLRGEPGSVSTNALPSIAGTLDGFRTWSGFIASSPNVQFTLNGHVADCDGVGAPCSDERNLVGVTGRSVATGEAGLPVYRMLANYQNVHADGAPIVGDAGFIRLLRFFPATGTVYVRTYSPTLDRYLTDSRNQFFLTDVDLSRTRHSPVTARPPTQTFTDTVDNAFRTEITAMRSVGVAGGYTDGTFRPRGTITREAAAAMVHRAAPGAQSTGPGTCAAHGVRSAYVDVPDDHPFCWAIYELSRTGRVTGNPDGTFRPSAPVRREAFAAFMFPRSGTDTLTATGFTDVATDGPLAVPVVHARAAGVINGYGDGSFLPSATITREAAAAMLARYYFPLA